MTENERRLLFAGKRLRDAQKRLHACEKKSPAYPLRLGEACQRERQFDALLKEIYALAKAGQSNLFDELDEETDHA